MALTGLSWALNRAQVHVECKMRGCATSSTAALCAASRRSSNNAPTAKAINWSIRCWMALCGKNFPRSTARRATNWSKAHEGVHQDTQAASDSLGGKYRPDGALPVLSGGVQNPDHGKGWAAPVPRLPRADHHARRGGAQARSEE